MVRVSVEGTAFWVAICSLAVWRLTAFVCYERGPFDLGTRLRRRLATGGMQRVLGCFHCTAVWLSLLIVSIVFAPSRFSPVLVLGVAGIASVIERWLGGAFVGFTEERHDG